MANPTKSAIVAVTMLAMSELIGNRFVSAKGRQATADDSIFGIVPVDAKQGESVAVEILGVSIVESGGAIEEGDKIGSDTQGCAIKSETGQFIALSATSGANEPVKVLLR
ncbi:DUF2190 family protein [Moraxella catarrhalis]|uniref:DUF2190 family protein n=1 Tax=Moraxella catarrhalis TaxID=480 RepID=UPI0007E4A03A|nr:DUF2190 family protein [Moraxella catarrhalis]MPY07400.1 DUF2190 family protein [Moraxella catarrhalis]OAV23678.1 hypothetical protein AO371_1169 [Moraxella catarrhalis]